MNDSNPSALAEWRAVPGVAQVFDQAAATAAYSNDTGGVSRRIAAALKIDHGSALPAVLAIARRHGCHLYPFSTGKNWGYGSSLPVQDDAVIVDLSGMQRFCVDPVLGVVTLEPGVTQGMLARFLDEQGYPFMVPVTGAGPGVSLLGNALERGYGITPHSDHFGAVTDLEAVLADGSLYRTALSEAGGHELAQLFKWGITSYSAGLFTQSGLGIVTRMSIVLARRPETVKVCLFNLRDDALLEPAVEKIRHILATLPGTVGGLNLMNRHRVLAMTAPYPAADVVDGTIPDAVIARLGRQYQIAPWTGFGTLYGTRGMVAAAQKEIRAALRGIASRLLFLSPKNAHLLARASNMMPGPLGKGVAATSRTLAHALELVGGRPNETALPLAYWRNPGRQPDQDRNPARDGCGLRWYAPLVPMRGADARAYVDMVTRVTREHGLEPLLTFTSISDRLFDSTVPLLFDHGVPGAAARTRECYDALVQQGRTLGVFPYRVGVDVMEVLAQRMPHAAAFNARIRAALDPERIIARGRY
ncbi:FAD-binding oxidoreductase [Pseudoduganella lutea]|uniref:FAD-binding oxidoreductase n=1 Tax=Pseudoduganella lutea TaxID=321985 RepID=A0A4P6KXY6_9BURK|nr:FAD-binding protein [Pseudoduganella lutea]QBE63605.1 FAD-binding oxidoreductase [Pseudoduganella lutea]